MTAVASLTGESVKSLGAGAYLVSVLPSATLVLSIAAISTSRLYPWAHPLSDNGKKVPGGLESVIYSATQAGAGGVAVLTLASLAGAVLLRPFQIALVQVLEGYWRGGTFASHAIDRHMMRRRVAEVRRTPRVNAPERGMAEDVAAYARSSHRARRMRARAIAVSDCYPVDAQDTLPTTLGNILRASETSAGERYGLNTVRMFPRLYPYLSPRLDSELKEQTNVLDASAAFTLLFAALTVLSAPLIVRVDWWSLVPFGTAAVAFLAYHGACRSAALYGTQLMVAFDLHRFEMLAAMRQRTPVDGYEEHQANIALDRALHGKLEKDHKGVPLRYEPQLRGVEPPALTDPRPQDPTDAG